MKAQSFQNVYLYKCCNFIDVLIFTATWLIFDRALHSKHSWEDVACFGPSSPHNRTRDPVFLLYSKTLQILHLDSLLQVVSRFPLLIVYATSRGQYLCCSFDTFAIFTLSLSSSILRRMSSLENESVVIACVWFELFSFSIDSRLMMRVDHLPCGAFY